MNNKRVFNTIIIGSGAAAFNCANRLYDAGVKDIALLTEDVNAGTSRNTGSDKQTYYKLSLAGKADDSVYKLAKTLFDGGGVDGDICLTEAANSLDAFYNLSRLGVPFPTNMYGEYAGYKTDHDPAQRATSAGPLTSKMMTEALEKEVNRKGIPIFDGFYAAKILTKDGRAAGVLAIDKNKLSENYGVTVFNSLNVVLATGGSAGVYYNSVYPFGHTGSSSLAVCCGAQMSNLCEWQYGLASVKFRWNVSGTYQQVLPRFISIDKNGNEKEFLPEYFSSPYKALDAVFLKGYQWPFDSRKINGSSVVDVIVHNEINIKGNRVFMDFRREPSGLENGGFDKLCPETYEYLKNSGALINLPINRLKKMNVKAIELYKNNGIDIKKEPLEVAVCSQHINGGVYTDVNYESSVKSLYVCGEAAGTFGVYRPGGAALNSTQVSGIRVAEKIASEFKTAKHTEIYGFENDKKELISFIKKCESDKSNISVGCESYQKAMSGCAAYIRRIDKIKPLYAKIKSEIANFSNNVKFADSNETVGLLKFKDILLTQAAILNSIIYQYESAGSRGGSLFTDGEAEFKDGRLVTSVLPENPAFREKIIITQFDGKDYVTRSQDRKPIPEKDDWFENVWNEYNKRKGI